MKNTIAPMNATDAQLSRLGRDHTESGDFCLMTDGIRVWLSEQPMGFAPKQGIEIPRRIFNRLLRWYTKQAKFVR